MKPLLALAMLALCLVAANAAGAAPTLAGPTGTGVLPSAGAYRPDKTSTYAHAALDLYNYGVQTGNAALLRYSFGIDNVEVGYGGDIATVQLPPHNYHADLSDSIHENAEDDDGYGLDDFMGEVIAHVVLATFYDSYAFAGNRQFNAKVRVQNLPHGDGIAVGYRHGQTERHTSTPVHSNQVYLVSTRTLLPGDSAVPHVRGSVGVNWTRVANRAGRESAVRPFAGAEMHFGNSTSLAADVQFPNADLDDASLYSLVLRGKPFRATHLELGVTNLARDGVSGMATANLFAGMTFSFSTR